MSKTRKQKSRLYEEKYSDIPRDFLERVNWLCDKLNIVTEKQYDEILNKRDHMISQLFYSFYKVILYEEPEGSPRPRFRLINRQNLLQASLASSNFVHVYSITGKDDNLYMKRLVTSDELYHLNSIIYTPCEVEYITYLKTPDMFSKSDQILAEIGLIRPISKPDWDNIGKKYSDMYNHNVWIDDANVIKGTVEKYYSCLPRVEINLKFLNALYNRLQAKSMYNKVNEDILHFNHKGELINYKGVDGNECIK